MSTGSPIQLSHSGWESLALGKQRGSTGSKHAIDPVVGFGLSKIPRYRAALSCAKDRQDPWHRAGSMPADFRFAAEQTASRVDRLRSTRQRPKGFLRDLSARTKGLSAALREQQSPNVRRVAGKLALGLVAVIVLLILWPDGTMPRRFITGFQSINALEETRNSASLQSSHGCLLWCG